MSALEHLNPSQFKHRLPEGVDLDDMRLLNGKYLIHNDEIHRMVNAYRVTPGEIVHPYKGYHGGPPLKVPNRVGSLTWFGGNPELDENGVPKDSPSNINNGMIYKVRVSGPHRRKGVASGMLDLARERHPEQHIRHSGALSEDGAAWAQAKP